jgi:saccharopepsin
MESQMMGLSQKYMGVRPTTHLDSMFQSQSPVDAEKGHPLPITNFMMGDSAAIGF